VTIPALGAVYPRMKRALLIAAVVAAGVGYATASHAASATVPACPSRAPKFASQGAAAKRFVRSGATAMRLCRYYGVNWGDSYGLRKQGLVRDHVTIGSVTRSFNRLQEPPRGIFCVKDDGSELLVVFAHKTGRAERVVVKLGGCLFATNGHSTRWATQRLKKRLLNLINSR